MFYLTPNPKAARMQKRCEKELKAARTALSDSSEGLSFEPEEHRYMMYGRQMRSVSSIVEHFSTFDAEKAAAGCSKNPKHELYGRTPEEILAIWQQRANDAAAAGTVAHEFAEACCDYLIGGPDAVDEKFRDRITPQGLEARTPKEEAAARWWAAFAWSRFAVVAKETRVVNVHLGYAGTFDLLLYEPVTGLYHIRDYKTNADLHKWHGSMMRAPLTILRDNDIGHYTVQQTLYAVQLRNIGLPMGENVLVWLRADATPEEVRLETKYERMIEFAVKQFQLTHPIVN